MIGKIAPLVRGSSEGNRYLLAHVAGGAIGGMCAGLVLAFAGLMLAETMSPDRSLVRIILGGTLLFLGLNDIGLMRSPIPGFARQTPASWVCTLGRVGGVGAWGWDLGLGFSTRLVNYSIWALPMFVLATGDFLQGVIIMVVFGLSRALTIALVIMTARDHWASVSTFILFNAQKARLIVGGICLTLGATTVVFPMVK